MNHIYSIFDALRRNAFISDAEQAFVLRIFRKSKFLLHMIAYALNFYLNRWGDKQIVDLTVSLFITHAQEFNIYPGLAFAIVKHARTFEQAETVVSRSPLGHMLREQPFYKELELAHYRHIDTLQNRACRLVSAKRRQKCYLVKCLLLLAEKLKFEIFATLQSIYRLYPSDLSYVFKLQVLWEYIGDYSPPRTNNVVPSQAIVISPSISDLYYSEMMTNYFSEEYKQISERANAIYVDYTEFSRICGILHLSEGEIGVAADKLRYELDRIGLR